MYIYIYVYACLSIYIYIYVVYLHTCKRTHRHAHKQNYEHALCQTAPPPFPQLHCCKFVTGWAFRERVDSAKGQRK